jgi:hypothetical protein
MFYLKIKTKEKKIFFFSDNQEIIHFWFVEIEQSKKFYEWLRAFIDLRYSKANQDNKDFSMKADELMSTILGMTLPEIDVDLYSSSQKGVTIEQYAQIKAQEFRSSLNQNIAVTEISSNTSQGVSYGLLKSPSTDECLSGDHSSRSGNTPNRKGDNLNKTQEIIYEYEDQKESSGKRGKSDFKAAGLNKSYTTYEKKQAN